MKGFQLSFLTVQGHRHEGKPVCDWLVRKALEMGIHGATVITGTEGYGRHHRIHSAHFVELDDQPVEVVMAVTEEEAARLFALLESERVSLFYVKAAVEFGAVGEPENGSVRPG